MLCHTVMRFFGTPGVDWSVLSGQKIDESALSPSTRTGPLDRFRLNRFLPTISLDPALVQLDPELVERLESTVRTDQGNFWKFFKSIIDLFIDFCSWLDCWFGTGSGRTETGFERWFVPPGIECSPGFADSEEIVWFTVGGFVFPSIHRIYEHV